MNSEIYHFTSSKILKQSTRRNIQFSILVYIENFPSFVTTKAEYESVSINFNNTEWFVTINLYKYCQTNKGNIRVTPSSPDQPETLAAFVCGRRGGQKECSFDVDAIFKFKQPAREDRESHKFCFNSTKHYDSWGYRKLARIDVILDLLFVVIFFTINLRIFWTFAMAIWLIIHSSCSSTFQFPNANEFLALSIAEWILNWLIQINLLLTNLVGYNKSATEFINLNYQ